MKICRFTFVLATVLTSLFSATVYSATIVRLQLEYAGSIQNLDLELFSDTAPLTVANYLDYVNNGSYDGSFIYRSMPGFILQTGGYTFRPVDPINNPNPPLRPISEAGTALKKVATGTLSPVVNEYNLSNIRGTIAMAKLDKQPDSATNEWYINLADNSANLDYQNGGFTVFGSIVDDGMTIADDISSQPIHQFIKSLLGSAFSNMPVTGEVFGAIYRQDMIMINSATVISRPVLHFQPAKGDFRLDVAGDSIDKILTVTMKNTGDEALAINAVNPTDISAPFSITNDTCSSTILVPQSVTPTSICTVDFVFAPTTSGAFNDSLLVTYISQNTSKSYSVTYSLKGDGVPSSPVMFSETNSLAFPDAMINTNNDDILTVRNKGGGTLMITNISIIGTDLNDFSILSGCNTGTNLAIDESCDVNLRFLPTSAGIKNSTLRLESNAGILDINLSGTGTKPVISIAPSYNLVAQLNQTATKFEYLTNTGTGNLLLGKITITGPDAAFFTQLNNCPDTNNVGGTSASLGPTERCILQIGYTPTTDGAHSATLTIDSNAPDTPSIDISLNGLSGDPAISLPGSLFIGTAEVNGLTARRNLTIKNTGPAPLEIASITGLPANGFTQSNNCVGTGIQIQKGSFCTVSIAYAATTIGDANAAINIVSNDPSNPTATVFVAAYGDNDTDGILSSIELNGPNAGDSNIDGIADDVQSAVATLLASNSRYITINSDFSQILKAETTLNSVVTTPSESINISGNDITFDFGLQGFNVNLPIGDGVYVAIFLPPDVRPTRFYKFGPTLDNITPHWYDFNYDSTTGTGATFIGKVSLGSKIGKAIEKYMIIVSYIDGGRGDDDLLSNGEVVNNKSGIYFAPSSTDSGALSYYLLVAFIGVFGLRLRDSSATNK